MSYSGLILGLSHPTRGYWTTPRKTGRGHVWKSLLEVRFFFTIKIQIYGLVVVKQWQDWNKSTCRNEGPSKESLKTSWRTEKGKLCMLELKTRSIYNCQRKQLLILNFYKILDESLRKQPNCRLNPLIELWRVSTNPTRIMCIPVDRATVTHTAQFLTHKLQPSLNLCTHSEYTLCTESGYGMLITNIITHSPN